MAIPYQVEVGRFIEQNQAGSVPSRLYRGPLGELAAVAQMNAELDALAARAPKLDEFVRTGLYLPTEAQRQQWLAEELIRGGQLSLGPEAFTSPEARLALASALTRSPVGGAMSSPFMTFAPNPGAAFGLGGTWSGGTMPNSFLGGIFTPEVGGSLIGALGGIAGSYLQYQWQLKAQEEAAKAQRRLLELQLMQQQLALTGRMQGQVVVGPGGVSMEGGVSMAPGEPPCNPMIDPMCAGPVWTPGPMLTGGGGGCCPRGAITVTPADAPGLYRQGCSPCSPVQTRARFFALRADGTRDLFVRVGKVQSVSPRTLTRFARRWAKEAKLTVGARGGRRGRGGRRRPR